MKIHNSILWLMAMAVATAFTLVACSSDDENNTPEQQEKTAYDDLDFFQRAIIDMDSLGTFRGRQWGEVLYANDTTQLYIGVETLAKAEEIFLQWMAPDVKPTGTDGNGYTAALTDEEGKPQGTVRFTPGTGANVAEVTASPETPLKHFSRITFLRNSAWPHNSSSSRWHVGDIVRDVKIKSLSLKGDAKTKLDEKDMALNYVCIREAGNGINPMFCAITNGKYLWPGGITLYVAYAELVQSKYCPDLSTAQTIQKILVKDWDFFVALFDEAGEGKLEKGGYWIDYQHSNFFKSYNQVFYYDTGYNWGAGNMDGKRFPILVKMDYWIKDSDFKDGGTY